MGSFATEASGPSVARCRLWPKKQTNRCAATKRRFVPEADKVGGWEFVLHADASQLSERSSHEQCCRIDFAQEHHPIA